MWAVSHFHTYLYGNDVTIYLDHSAVKAVLETPNPSVKHAQWWSRVYGNGVRIMQIVYKSCKENLNVDSLSCSPHGSTAREIQAVQVTVDQLMLQMAHTSPLICTERQHIRPSLWSTY